MDSRAPGLDQSLLDTPGTVLVDDLDVESGVGHTYLFREPLDVITTDSPDDTAQALSEIDRWTERGLYAAGYLAYDAGLGLDKPIHSRSSPDLPLLWFALYRECQVLDYAELRGATGSPEDIVDAHLNVPDRDYASCVRRIIDYISSGDVYQVNYTCKFLFENLGSASSLFVRLRTAHPVCHSAFVNTGDLQVVSISPELFLRKSGDHLTTRPMKGTVRRGRYCGEDSMLADFLAHDAKNRAENLMIVDLMRNDLGRVCAYGSVEVSKLFHIEPYRSLFQMTSTATGSLNPGVSVAQIMKATFPPGSVTGAPKIRAMEIISELEPDPRGVYCGSVGFFKPDGDFLLNVAIRTIVQRGSRCQMGVGSGIVADSDPEMELQEAMLKAQFVRSEVRDFRLLETLLFRSEEGFVSLEEHLERMRRSAEYFGWAFIDENILDALENAAAEIASSLRREAAQSARVRLLLGVDQRVAVEWSALEPVGGPVRLRVSSRQTDPEDIYLYHKTTNRSSYDEDLRSARREGYFDVLYLNVRGEVAECAVTNVALEIGDKLFTPQLDSGLLPGIWRQQLLDRGAVERVVTLADLAAATHVFVGNSVRGTIEVERIDGPDGTIWNAGPCDGPTGSEKLC